MKNGINTAEIGKKLMECSVFKAKILTKSSIKIANASLFEILLRDLEISKRMWMFVDEPTDPLDRIANAFILTNQAIRWELIKDQNALRIWNSYLDWSSNYCPHIFSIHLELIAIVKKSGLDTLEQRKAIVLEIIEKYRLGAFISLENKF